MTRVSWLLVLLAGVVTGCDTPTFRVHGPSMGLALPGAHLQWPCPECQRVTRCDPIALAELTCSNCGAHAARDRARQAPGTLVQLATNTPPQRWDLVAFTHRHQWMVKRVVGMPGEEVEIADGDVFINGARLVKEWAAFQRVCLTVHDDQFRPASPRWVGTGPEWTVTSSGYRWQGAGAALEYHHREPGLPHASPHQLFDSYGYNPGLSRELHEVRDVAVRWELKLEGDARLEVKSAIGSSATFDASGATLVGTQHPSLSLPPNQWWSCGFGTWDGYTHLEVNGTAATAVPSPPPTTEATPVPVFRFLATGEGTLALRVIRVERDLYY